MDGVVSLFNERGLTITTAGRGTGVAIGVGVTTGVGVGGSAATMRCFSR